MRKNHAAPFAALATVLIALASVLGFSSPAAAHDDFVSSYPQADSTINRSPDEITLTFSGELTDTEDASVVEVFDEQGANVAIDSPGISGTSITQHLAPEAATGAFTVRWKVVSADGHPVSGEYTYTVEPMPVGSDVDKPEGASPSPSASEEAAEEPVTEASASPAETTKEYGGIPSGGGAFEFLPLLALSAFAIILGGGVIGVVLMGRQRRQRDRAQAAREDAKGVHDGA